MLLILLQYYSCDSYTWLGTTYTASGVYDSLFTNSSGCDSLVVLDLTSMLLIQLLRILHVILIYGLAQHIHRVESMIVYL